MFEEVLGLKTILLGFGLDSDVIHSPNEHFGLFNFYKGIETIPHFYKKLCKFDVIRNEIIFPINIKFFDFFLLLI